MTDERSEEVNIPSQQVPGQAGTTAAPAVSQGISSGPGEQKGKGGSEEDRDVSALREWMGFVFRVAFWALLLYLFLFQVSVVEGPSMQPNFQTFDRLVIDKLTYRFSKVKRFDVVVFQAKDMHPYHGLAREYKDYIKRVVGLPGETVTYKDGQVAVDGQVLDEPFNPNLDLRNYGEYHVPPHYYLVMGDNRGDSKDSRSAEMGFVPESQIRGLVRLRFAPLSRWTWFSRGK